MTFDEMIFDEIIFDEVNGTDSKQVVGGYNPLNWNTSSDIYGEYKNTTEGFIFNTILLLKYTFVIKAQNSSDGLIVRFLV